MARRGPCMEHAGTWEFPGGKVELGESDEAALTRELHEELAWAVRVGSRVGEGTTGHVHLVGYLCESDGEPRLDEHDAGEWLSPVDLAPLAWAPADGPVIEGLTAFFLAGGYSTTG